ncbi:MAG: DUF4157 domain-containing protein [Pseudobacteriovorax sp.]|nr:DUF4157 domain-containing protein [Pseudobacteriovorax sp.]
MYKNQTSRKTSIQRKPNNTGLSDQVKNGIEDLSGMNMPDVKVHYNSPKPAAVRAHAYTQGSDIHVASGHGNDAADETWHAVQKKRGRGQPTTSVGRMTVNDNAGLEREADVMEARAASFR